MRIETALKIAKAFILEGSRPIISTEWIMTSCPFARKTHEKGIDRKPSFGINYKHNTYNCFACGKSGKLETLPFELRMLFPFEEYDWLIKLIVEGNDRRPSFRQRIGIEEKHTNNIVELPKEILRFFEPLNFTYKNITPEIGNKYGVLMANRDSGKLKALVFPYIDYKDRLVALKKRFVCQTTQVFLKQIRGIKLKGSSPRTCGVWYLENFVVKNTNRKRIYVTEGERDALLLNEFLINNGLEKDITVVCSSGAKLTNGQTHKIAKALATDEVVLLFDNDKAGLIASKILYLRIYRLFKVLRPKNWFGCKDPAEAVEKGYAGDLIAKENLKEVKKNDLV